MTYPQAIVGSIVDALVATDFQWSVIDIIQTDSMFPNLSDDIATELWQRQLIAKQFEDQKASDGK